MENFIKTTELSLSSASYSVAPSALTNGLWSLIRNSLLFHYLLFYLLKKERRHLCVNPQATFINCLDTWLKWIGSVSRQECWFIFRTLFILYISQFLPHFLLFHHCWSLEKELFYSGNFAPITLLTSLPSFFRWDHHLSRNHLLGKSPFPFLHSISHLCFSSWLFTSFREAINLGTWNTSVTCR